MERTGKGLHRPILRRLRTFLHLVTSSVGKQESLSAQVGQNGPEWRLCCQLAHRHNHASHWYLLACRG
jgi:hypothetical protein